MRRSLKPLRIVSVAASLLAALSTLAAPALAGSITLDIRTTVDTAEGLSLRLKLTNKGDEAAHQVVPRIRFGDRKSEGRPAAAIKPGASHEWDIDLLDQRPDPGTYAVVTSVSYRDSNEYPLEVVSASSFSVDTRRKPAVKGRFTFPRLSPKGRVEGKLHLEVPAGRGSTFDVVLVTPSGLIAPEPRREVRSGGAKTVTIPVAIKNRSVLPGSRMNVFALVTGEHAEGAQTDVIRGVVVTAVPAATVTKGAFATLFVTSLFFFVVLQVLDSSGKDERIGGASATAADYAMALMAPAFILYHLPWNDLLSATTAAGGDMASLFYPTRFMSEELVADLRLTGWTMGNYAGFPIFHFYSTFPFLVIVIIGKLFPLEVVFKLVTLIGPVFLPLAAAYLFRCLGYGAGAAAMAAASTLPMLFQQGNSMWGGNIPSVLAGEFCHAIGITLSLVFLGVLHRATRDGAARAGWLLAAVLLTIIGLSHTFAFIAAVWCSLFYLRPGPTLDRRAHSLIPVYVLAFLLLCFWGLPLPARVQFTTEWAMIWRIKEWREVLPEPLWPAAILSVANFTVVGLSWLGGLVERNTSGAVASAAKSVSEFKRARAEREGVLTFGLVGMGLLYLLAPAVGFPDIRFIPVAQIFLGLLAADFIYWTVSRLRYAPLFGLSIMLAALAWTDANLGYVPSWLRWNYSGYESKPTWPLFKKINEHVAGDLNDPRVVFEHSQKHNQFGGSRAFENLPLFSGRSTLEGVFHQASLNSSFIFYIQSEASERGSGPFRQYTYARLDPDKAAPHLLHYNVSDVIVVTEAAKAAYAASDKFERTFRAGAYEVYRLRQAPPGYVTAADNEPVLYEGPDWKLAFYRWFKHPELLDVPLVPADLLPRTERFEFSSRTDTPRRIPRFPYVGDCHVTSRLEHHRITFETDCPGRPHIVKVSYFPRWRTSDGSPVHPVSPGFMMVYPSATRMELVYGRNAMDWLSLFLTIGGLGILAACMVSSAFAERFRRSAHAPFLPLTRGLSAHPRLAALILVILAAAAGAATRYTLTAPEREFQAAKQLYRDRDFPAAIEAYRQWTADDKGTFKQATALYQMGVSHSELGHHGAAVQILERLRFEFPNVNYGPGSLYHLAINYAGLEMPERAKEAAALLAEEPNGESWLVRLQRKNPELIDLSGGATE